MWKQGTTIFLRLAVVGIGLIILALCIFAVPPISRGIGLEFPNLSYWEYPVLVGLYAVAAIVFSVLYQAMKLLTYIDKNIAFSDLSVMALRKIKYAAVAIGILFAGLMPLIYYIAQIDDAPGLILIFGTIFIGTPIVIAVFAALLQKLLENAIDIKKENDLVV